MKHSKRIELQNLVSGIIGFVGLASIIVLVCSVTKCLISFRGFIAGMIIAGVVLSLDSVYIEKHFVDGEWV